MNEDRDYEAYKPTKVESKPIKAKTPNVSDLLENLRNILITTVNLEKRAFETRCVLESAPKREVEADDAEEAEGIIPALMQQAEVIRDGLYRISSHLDAIDVHLNTDVLVRGQNTADEGEDAIDRVAYSRMKKGKANK